jgi:hypothetical protein
VERSSVFQSRGPAVFEPVVKTETYSPQRFIEQISDGDIGVDNISGNCKINLESRHGSIRVAHQIGECAEVTLKAAKGVIIGQGIGHHATVQIVAGGDVTIGQAISENSQITITSAPGQLYIGAKHRVRVETPAATSVHIGGDIGQNSSAKITTQGDVTIGGSAHRQAKLDIISLEGTISIEQGIKDSAIAVVTAGKAVRIGENVSHHSKLTVMAHDDVTIGQKIDQEVDAKISSVTGSINIGQGMGGRATATLIAANGYITIGGGVDRGSTVNWNAIDFSCPHQDGAINRVS